VKQSLEEVFTCASRNSSTIAFSRVLLQRWGYRSGSALVLRRFWHSVLIGGLKRFLYVRQMVNLEFLNTCFPPFTVLPSSHPVPCYALVRTLCSCVYQPPPPRPYRRTRATRSANQGAGACGRATRASSRATCFTSTSANTPKAPRGQRRQPGLGAAPS